MKLKTHVGRTFGAVAIVGGTAAILFTGSPAHTQFSASSTQSVTLNGSSVGETITNGGFTCTGLTPPNNAVELGGTGIYPGSTCDESISFQNTGTIRESFDLTITSITGTQSALHNLNQLQFSINGTALSGSIPPLNTPVHLATIAAGASLSSPVVIGLVPETGDLAVQNAWNGASVSIGYTVTATPSDS